MKNNRRGMSPLAMIPSFSLLVWLDNISGITERCGVEVETAKNVQDYPNSLYLLNLLQILASSVLHKLTKIINSFSCKKCAAIFAVVHEIVKMYLEKKYTTDFLIYPLSCSCCWKSNRRDPLPKQTPSLTHGDVMTSQVLIPSCVYYVVGKQQLLTSIEPRLQTCSELTAGR